MKQFDTELTEVLSMTERNPGFYDMTLHAPRTTAHAAAGQFVNLYVPGHVLRRPISICYTDSEKETLRLVFQVRGEGTRVLSQCKAGDTLDILGPLGKGFPVSEGFKKVLLVGGGIGVPPLLGLAAQYRSKAVACLGFRSEESAVLVQDFQDFGAVVKIATEDGSLGSSGFVSALLESDADCIYACGPEAMLRAVCDFADQTCIPCYISLEAHMACGIGACLGCARALIDSNGAEYYGHVCKDGPVFDYQTVSGFSSMQKGGVKHGGA